MAPKIDNDKTELEIKIRNELKSDIKSGYTTIKIGSGTIAALCTGLITFSNNLIDNPFFAILLGLPNVNLILSIIISISVIWLLFTWFKEKKDERKKQWLFSERGKLEILASVVVQSLYNQDHDNKIIFSLNEFVNEITKKRTRYIRNSIKTRISTFSQKLFGSSNISISVAEMLARYHLSNLENSNVIKRNRRKSIEPSYEIERDLVHQLRDNYFIY